MSQTLVQDCIDKIEPLIQRLENFLSKNQQVQIKSQEFMKAYDSVQVLNTKGGRDQMAQMCNWYSEKIYSYIIKQFKASLEGKEYEEFLDELIIQWDNFKIYIYWLFMVLIIFDQGQKRTNGKSVQGNAFMILRDQIFKKMSSKINSIIFHYLESEREGNIVPKEKIVKVINYIVTLGYENDVVLDIGKQGTPTLKYINGNPKKDVSKEAPVYTFYEQVFLGELLQNTEKFYKEKGRQWMQWNSHEYVVHSLKSFELEINISQQYFFWSQQKYIEAIDQQLVIANLQHITQQQNGGIRSILKENKITEFEDMFTLFKRKEQDTYKTLASEIKAYIYQEGISLNQDEKLSKEALNYTQKVIDFKTRMDDIVKNSMDNQVIFQNSRDDAFKCFINEFDKSARFLAMYSDNELRSKLKGLTEEEVERKIQDIMNIFMYLYSKDTYLEDYGRFLSKRLLNQTSISDDWEAKMILSLKSEAGQSGVLKLTQMRQDIKISKEKIQVEFKEYLQENKININNMEVTVTVLTKSFWPIKFDEENCPKVPEEFEQYIEMFKKYYDKNFGLGRKLNFLVQQGTSEMYGYFANRTKKILQVTNFQVSILLQFNKLIGGQTTYSNLKQFTQIQENDMRENLLALVKCKILVREKGEKESDFLADFQDQERISFNEDFQHKQTKIKCVPGKDLKKKQDPKVLNEDELKQQDELKMQRQSILDAKIVMIMKSKKAASLNEIIESCTTLVTLFKPQARDIKLRIESLVEKDYLKRDSNDSTKFNYVP